MLQGIDLHKNDLLINTLDPAGELVEQRRIRTHRASVAQYFHSLPGPHRATVESTASWYWLADLLREEGVGLTLAHMTSPELRGVRDALRVGLRLVQKRLVQKRSRCQNALGALLTKYNVPSGDALPKPARPCPAAPAGPRTPGACG